MVAIRVLSPCKVLGQGGHLAARHLELITDVVFTRIDRGLPVHAHNGSGSIVGRERGVGAVALLMAAEAGVHKQVDDRTTGHDRG